MYASQKIYFITIKYFVVKISYKNISNISIIKYFSSDCAEIYAALESAYYREIKSQGRYKMESPSSIFLNSRCLIIADILAVYCNYLNCNQNCLTATNIRGQSFNLI